MLSFTTFGKHSVSQIVHSSDITWNRKAKDSKHALLRLKSVPHNFEVATTKMPSKFYQINDFTIILVNTGNFSGAFPAFQMLDTRRDH